MARIRSIKPEIRISEKVNSWPVEIRYFWIMLWGYVDDHGRGRDNAKLIVADSYPLDDEITHKDVENWLSVLEASGVIYRYEVDGSRYLLITNWLEHQRPAHPAKSVIPIPRENCGNPPQSSEDAPDDSEASESLSVNSSPEQGAESSEQRADEQVVKPAAPHAIPADFSLTLERKQWSKENAPAVNAARETQGFIDYWAGEQTKKKNWETTWRNWMRRKQTEAEAKGWKSQADLNSIVPAGYGWANR